MSETPALARAKPGPELLESSFFFWQNGRGDLSDHSTVRFWLYAAERGYEKLFRVQRIQQLSPQTAVPPPRHCLTDEPLFSTHPIPYRVPHSAAMVSSAGTGFLPHFLLWLHEWVICCQCKEFTTWKPQFGEKMHNVISASHPALWGNLFKISHCKIYLIPSCLSMKNQIISCADENY